MALMLVGLALLMVALGTYFRMTRRRIDCGDATYALAMKERSNDFGQSSAKL
jgi:hypothetical protein